MVRNNGVLIKATRTQQFRVKDVGFWKNKKRLSRYLPLSILATADAASLRIDNQKNGKMGQTLYLESTGPTGGVAALARRIAHILDNGGSDNNIICDVFANDKWTSVQSAHMVHATRAAVTSLNLEQQGIDPDLVGSHSLRAGGAMALKIMGFPDSTIRKMGRWSSDTWQMYIHRQIDKLHEGIAEAMSTPQNFTNIAFIEPPALRADE